MTDGVQTAKGVFQAMLKLGRLLGRPSGCVADLCLD